MKTKILLVLTCILICMSTLTGCSNKYHFEEAFFPIDLAEGTQVNNPYPSDIADEKYKDLIAGHLSSLTKFVNNEFNLNISKPLPEVRSYSPDLNLAASYLNGIIYINESIVSTNNCDYTIIHELLHYLSDNDGNPGFVHTVKYQNVDTHYLGYGITEGLTDFIAMMYCQKNNISIPEHIESGSDVYFNNRSIAQTYYVLQPNIINWFFTGDYVSLYSFVQNELEKVSYIPQQYIDDFDFYFHSYQDVLLQCGTGAIQDIDTYERFFKANFEIVAIIVRACPDEKTKLSIYDDVLHKHDPDNIIKDLIFD